MNLRYTPPGGAAVTLTNVRLSSFTTENLYEGEAFNRSGRKSEISGTAIITGNPLASGTGAIDVIRNSLNAPRGKLELAFDSQPATWYVLSDSSDATAASDARNGPLPSVNVSRIEGTHSAAVTFVSFTYTFWNCADTRIQQFSMSVSQTIDEAGFVTMTRSGTLRISAKAFSGTPSIATVSNPQQVPTVQNTDVGNSPDLYRNLVAGKPGQYFRRVNQTYTLNASLTTLEFSVEDRMVFREHKYKVMMGDASFSYERGLDNMLGTKNFSAQFEGEPGTDPSELLAVAVEAARARVDFAKDLIQSITVREPNIYSRNRVELSVVAKGQGGDRPDMTVIKQMFTDPHLTGVTKYASAYASGGSHLETVSGLRWDPCVVPTIIATVITPNPTDSGEGETTLAVEGGEGDAPLQDSEGNQIGTPLNDDDGIDTTDNFISHLTSTQTFDTEDSGMDYLEATGGAFQWPIQFRLPRVVVTQEVRYVTVDKSTPVPWPIIDDAFVVESQTVTVNHAPPDASGKPTFAVVARRQIVLQTATSPNRLVREDGVPRIVYSPETIPQARGLYSNGNRINMQQVNGDGVVTRQDSISGS